MLQSEQAVLGCLLFDPSKFAHVNQLLSIDDFNEYENREIFKAFKYLDSIGSQADLVLLRDRLRGKIDINYLISLSESVSFADNLISYCKAVKEESNKRKIVEVMQNTLEKINDPDARSKDLVAGIMKDSLAIDTFFEDKFTMREALDAYMKHLEEPAELVSTGFVQLDEQTNGGIDLHSLAVIVSDSGIGKTTLTTNMLVNKALKGEKCLYINLEIPVFDMLEIIIPQLSDEDTWVDYKNLVTKDDIDRIRGFLEEKLAGLGIYFARNCYSKEEIVAQMDLHRMDYGVTSCFIDHAQLIEGSEDYTKYVGITKEIKRYCLRHSMAIFLLCQTNDNKEKRGDKEPRKTDLRGGANLYQDADIVLFLYRLDVAEKQVYLKLAKNRKGSSGEAVYYAVKFDEARRKVSLAWMAERPIKEEDEGFVKKRRSRYDREY